MSQKIKAVDKLAAGYHKNAFRAIRFEKSSQHFAWPVKKKTKDIVRVLRQAHPPLQPKQPHLNHAQRDGRVVRLPGLVQLVVEHGQHLAPGVQVAGVLAQAYGQGDDPHDDRRHQVVRELGHAQRVGGDGQLGRHRAAQQVEKKIE